jgi:hypothetical protein
MTSDAAMTEVEIVRRADHSALAAALRRRAALECLHRCRVVVGVDDDHPWGRLEELALWCAGHIGPRWVDWYYRGDGVWCFRRSEDMVMFAMTWS